MTATRNDLETSAHGTRKIRRKTPIIPNPGHSSPGPCRLARDLTGNRLILSRTPTIEALPVLGVRNRKQWNPSRQTHQTFSLDRAGANHATNARTQRRETCKGCVEILELPAHHKANSTSNAHGYGLPRWGVRSSGTNCRTYNGIHARRTDILPVFSSHAHAAYLLPPQAGSPCYCPAPVRIRQASKTTLGWSGGGWADGGWGSGGGARILWGEDRPVWILADWRGGFLEKNWPRPAELSAVGSNSHRIGFFVDEVTRLSDRALSARVLAASFVCSNGGQARPLTRHKPG